MLSTKNTDIKGVIKNTATVFRDIPNGTDIILKCMLLYDKGLQNPQFKVRKGEVKMSKLARDLLPSLRSHDLYLFTF